MSKTATGPEMNFLPVCNAEKVTHVDSLDKRIADGGNRICEGPPVKKTIWCILETGNVSRERQEKW